MIICQENVQNIWIKLRYIYIIRRCSSNVLLRKSEPYKVYSQNKILAYFWHSYWHSFWHSFRNRGTTRIQMVARHLLVQVYRDWPIAVCNCKHCERIYDEDTKGVTPSTTRICRQMKLLSANLFSARRLITIRNHEIYSRGTEVWGTIVINTPFAT